MEDINHDDFGNFTLYPPVLWEMNSSDDEFLSTINYDELDSIQISSIGCDTEKLDECLKQPALDIPPPELPATVSTSEPVQKRFKTVSKQEQERLFEARQAPTTKKNTLWGMKIFQGWGLQRWCTFALCSPSPLTRAEMWCNYRSVHLKMVKRKLSDNMNMGNLAKAPKLSSFGFNTPTKTKESGEDSKVSKTPKIEIRSFKETWKFNRPWLRYDAKSKSMFCDICINAQVCNTFTIGCTILKKESVVKHTEGKELI
ncbi:hypothetical protein KUTeg_018770 [Tegillarca granosa]|uniref:C17orf113 probable zinc finger domain-containing protein n=1 Tax=Tegillarca granosa TaxID=220873 RepID=A0ABQ9EJU2_TEGGR|nr:hypothetical protein KUTeg_018770 [Tegillarca granosa]